MAAFLFRREQDELMRNGMPNGSTTMSHKGGKNIQGVGVENMHNNLIEIFSSGFKKNSKDLDQCNPPAINPYKEGLLKIIKSSK